MPLDRSGRVPGRVRLFVERRAPRRSASGGALFALAGGPGQAGAQLDFVLALLLRPALANRQLVVFDERGTGRSDPLRCPASLVQGAVPPVAAVNLCAARLGPRRAFYTSRDSADDIDAVRRSIGVDKIELYGVSYGTYTALSYARRYPEHVESLILDSTVPPGGLDPLDRATYAAVPRMLHDVCSGGACSSITPDPVADLDLLVPDLARRPRLAVAFDGQGGPQPVRVSADAVHDLVLGADLDPFLAAGLPSLIRSSVAGDPAPLARALRNARMSAAASGGPGPELDAGAYLARTCEDTTLPWPRVAQPSERRGDLSAAVQGLGPSVFSPWDPQTEIDRGTASVCLGWPDASPVSPADAGPLPDVPALILGGEDDMRTPIENAQQVASQLPRANVVVVPHAGHSVLETDCGEAALEAFTAGRNIAPCRGGEFDFSPNPLPPRSVRQLHPAGGVGGLPGRTLTAVNQTLADALLHSLVGLFGDGPSIKSGPRLSVGGLRGGFVRFDFSHRRSAIVFHHYAYVPGVTLSGEIGPRRNKHSLFGRLIVGGSTGAHGVLRLGRRDLAGFLGGRRVTERVAEVSAAHDGAATGTSLLDVVSSARKRWHTACLQLPYARSCARDLTLSRSG